MKKLTIGIPVLNCCSTIENCLLPLLSSENDEFIKIIILINDSKDGSEEIIRKICKDHAKADIKIIDDGPAKGIEHAIWRLVDLCKTEWIWLLSGDDIPVENWRELASQLIESNNDLGVFQTIQADGEGQPLFYRNNMRLIDPTIEWSFSFPKEKDVFLNKIKSTDAIFSCISNVIFKKSLWQDTKEDDYLPYKGTNFMHSMRLLAHLNTATHMKASGAPLVFKRGGEDSFGKLGLIGRALMTYESYGQNLKGFSSSDLVSIKSAADYEWPWYKCVKVIREAEDSVIREAEGSKMISKFLQLRFRNDSIFLFLIASRVLKPFVYLPLIIKLKKFFIRKY